METQEKTMNENESLELIAQMINSTKRNLKEDGIIFLFWGYLTLSTCILNYVLYKMGYAEKSGWVWIIVMILGGITSAVLIYKKKKSQKVKTHIDSMMSYVWIGFGISMFVSIFSLCAYGYYLAMAPIIMMLYGIGTFTTGSLLKFRPLVWGGLSCWVFALASTFFSSEIQLLFICLSLITSYIIPGHLLRREASNN